MYKRQSQVCLYVLNSCRDRFAMIKPKKEIGPTSAVAIAIRTVTPSNNRRIVSVSYTHLDVYKRQL